MRSQLKQKKPKMGLKIVLSCLLLLVAVLGTYAYTLYRQTNLAIDKIGTDEPVTEVEAAAIKTKPLTVLLLGIDHREDTGSLNSDVIMVVTVNPMTQSATVVSLPRDMQLAPKGLPSRKANYYYPYFYNSDRDHAYEETKKVFSDYLDVPIDYVVTVDFDGFRQTVDILGGLTVNVDMDMRYVDDEDGTNINLKKGVAKLSGKQVLDFVRYRKSNRGTEDSSDLERNQRQQQVLNELLTTVKSAGGITKLNQIIQAVGDHMRTDVPSSQIRELISTYFTLKPSNVNYIHLDGDWESPYIIVKDEDIDKAREALKLQRGESLTSADDGENRVGNGAFETNTQRSGSYDAGSTKEPGTGKSTVKPTDKTSGANRTDSSQSPAGSAKDNNVTGTTYGSSVKKTQPAGTSKPASPNE
ncbi:LCP family protein [Paenibacillus rigui]|uniref:Transcriptional regulator n=1 Tax=Paenibacillus rigui TaxID=554312 RepID=A0A229UJX3_9BACL|nr:LCP family protein [Paenibacillus rigui]OXM83671.1 transcriptional regulator [Paenibacillus rigui]